MIRRALVLVLAIAALLAARHARAEIFRPVVETRLDNGLRLVISPDPTSVEVSVMIVYDTGARDEPAGLEGLAHLVEHLMFLGTKHAPRGALGRLLEQAGATEMNGTTSVDTTAYFETLPPERLALALWLEADRMGYGLDALDDATLARAKDEVRNERRERVTEVPIGEVPELVRRALFPSWHPYHHLPVGTPASIDRATVADARAFARTWYGPANAVLTLAGAVDPAAATALVERYFGTLPRRAPPVRPYVPDPTAHAPTVLHVGASVTRREVVLSWVTPRFGAPGDAELDLAAAILVNRGAGWLEESLYRPPRLATQVTAVQRSMNLASIFEIDAVVAEGRPMKEVCTRILAALAQFERGVRDEDIQRARREFQNRNLFRLESSLSLAGSLASAARFGPLPPLFDGQMGRYATITPSAVRGAVRAWLGAEPWVIAIAQPSPGRPTAGEVMVNAEVAW